MLHLLFKSEALYLVGLDLCYEKLILIFHIEKIALFEFQKRVFHSLDLNPSGSFLERDEKCWNCDCFSDCLFVSYGTLCDQSQSRSNRSSNELIHFLAKIRI